MAWYRTGTVALTNGSATVTGTGTAFIANASIGEAFLGPDGRAYEITDIPSNTSLTISPAYLGSTASGQSYSILPARGRIADLIAETQSLLSSFATVRDGIGAGLFPDGSAATPAFRFSGDQDTGIYRGGSNILGIATAGVGRVFVNGDGNVGIGTASLTHRLHVEGNTFIPLTRSYYCYTTDYGMGTPDSVGLQIFSGDAIRFGLRASGTTFTERMRVASDGNVGIGTAAPGSALTIARPSGNGAEVAIQANGLGAASELIISQDSGSAAYIFNRANAFLSFGTNNVVRLNIESTGAVRPGADNTQTLGSGSFRWSVVYAGTGTINTSDEREKHWRGELSTAELRAAKRIIGELGIYQWNDAVEEKGEDGARLHFGVRAQRAFAIMDDEGLDWGRYAWACYDEWDEQTEPVMEEVTVTKTRKVSRPSTLIDPATGQPAMVEVDEAYEETEMQPTGETRVTLEAGDRYGVRPDQLAFWLIAAQAAMQADLEAQNATNLSMISILSARLDALEAAA